ncbi:uncharacterized protein LOC116604825 isoform X4 [Nematostella vectensis]|uniref:uncharacterized protein LOC116604825 isoform X4 n=1 Tax=Nematostella vectensis TaxID=45351 RepID=UPI00138FD6AD|nr:uncharacterized protein LOC116604825 isoform X4 [Nematostella vectensis]
MPRGEEIDEVRWVPGWDGILPECPPRPHLHGVWRLAEGATKWKNMKEHIRRWMLTKRENMLNELKNTEIRYQRNKKSLQKSRRLMLQFRPMKRNF